MNRDVARIGVAGVDRPALAKLAVAGVNTAPLQKAALGVAGNWSSPLRAEMDQITRKPPKIGANRLGDQAALQGWDRGVLFCDYQYLTCPDGPDRMRWRQAFRHGFALEHRSLPLYLDSGAYRRWSGQAESWDSLKRYLQAIDLMKPQGYMAYDTFGDVQASLQGFEQMVALGYSPIPVWQFRQAWDDKAETLVRDPYGVLNSEARAGIANARLAAKDPVLQHLCGRCHLVAIGGMAQSRVPRRARVHYIRELCRLFPDQQFWFLAQASETIINGIGQFGLLDRVWVDGSWWIHNARAERMAIMKGGLIRSIYLEGQARSFFTMSEMMASNLRALLGAYSGLWTFPAPAPIPDDLTDPEAVRELKKRLQGVQTSLLHLLPQRGSIVGYAEDEDAAV